jgi:hypothetical protein
MLIEGMLEQEVVASHFIRTALQTTALMSCASAMSCAGSWPIAARANQKEIKMRIEID